MKRRAWLLGTAAGAGALLVGWGALPPRSRTGLASAMPPGEGDIALNGWIKVLPEGDVVLAMPRSEMGQGVHTALPQLAAEELDVPLSFLRIEQAGWDAIYGNVAIFVAGLPLHPEGQEQGPPVLAGRVARRLVAKVARELGVNVTGGSSSIADLFDVVRVAAATARASLLGAASLQWHLPMEELVTRDGLVLHASGRSASYGELARVAAATPPGEVRLKERKAWRVIGQPARRLDVPAKVDGTARFGIDVRLPGMRFAAVRLCPMLGGAPGRIDAAAALARPGVERIVQLPAYAGSTAGFAVIAATSWHAIEAARAVEVEWCQRAGGALDSRDAAHALQEAVHSGSGTIFHQVGDGEQAREQGRVIEQWYSAPLLAHATMEPMNATALVSGGHVAVWAPTQVPSLARAAAARVAGVPLERVEVHVTLLGGGFGRRLEVDYVEQAVRVAMDIPGVPVQLLWPREEDMTHDFYRPMRVARMRAVLGASGKPLGLEIKSAGDAITPRWLQRGLPALAGPVELPDKASAEGLFDQAYAFPQQRVEHVDTHTGLPVGFWRSVGHSHNAFCLESFLDEVAVALHRDPVDLRRALLESAPRHRAVLEEAALRAGWGRPLAAGRALGVALHESFGSVVAQVAEVSIDDGVPTVHRVVCAIDCGTVVNPRIVAQQMEGAVVFALGAALFGRIDVHEGAVQQHTFVEQLDARTGGNFPAYPLLTMRSAPRVETWIVPSDGAPGGVGEPGVPAVAPAVANALFALTGRRHRSLPLAA